MDLTIVNWPTLTAATVAKVKANKRILHSLEDDLILDWIKAAEDYITGALNCSVMERTMTLRVSKILPSVVLPRPSVGSPATLVTLDSASATTAAGDVIAIDVGDATIRMSEMLPVVTFPEITAAYGLDSQTDGSMEITYKAGYDDAADVPPAIIQASILLASHYVTSREAAYMDPRIMNVEKKIAFGVDNLVKRYRIPNADAVINGGF